jgi:hypothetical protein
MNKKSKTIILALITIFVIALLFTMASPPNSAAAFIFVWLFLLIPGLTLAGVMIALAYIKLRKTKVTRPLLFGTVATGSIGAAVMTLMMTFFALNPLALESAIGFLVLLLLVIITSVITGPLVCVIISTKQ